MAIKDVFLTNNPNDADYFKRIHSLILIVVNHLKKYPSISKKDLAFIETTIQFYKQTK
jgi:hypothetical protein